MKWMPFLFLCCVSFLSAEANSGRTDLWKHGLKGPVQSCSTRCYRYDLMPDGTRTLERSMLEYAGSAYDVDSYYQYDSKGFIAEEKTEPFEEGLRAEKRIYDRDETGCILQVRVYVMGVGMSNPEKLKYEYDEAGRLIAIRRYNQHNRFVETVDEYKYDTAGNRIVEWVEEEIRYRYVLNKDGKCIEEEGVLPEGKEFYHNYHQYDAGSGRRIRTTFTVDKKIIEVRDNPYSDNVLDDGEILTTDAYGNWITMLFVSDEESGSMVIREIVYYP
ncbi:MAG: hypothetical protein RR212_13515 [Bacteroidales bacterium]